MSRSRFCIQIQFDGMYQSCSLSSPPSTLAPTRPLPYTWLSASYRPSPVGAQAVPLESIAGPPSSSRRWVFEVLLPKELAGLHVDRVDVVGGSRFDRDLFGTVLHDQRREQGVHLLWCVIELDLPEDC